MKRKIKMIEVSSLSELYDRVQHAKRGTWYVVKDSVKSNYDRRLFIEEARVLEYFLNVFVYCDCYVQPAVVFFKAPKTRRRK